ncbi:MAG: Manganese transport system membrane protein MntC [Chlamydiae bacterium]|nr:Manganese transport system membrane protein MntC [Chlamydiota bacterium]
MTSFFTDPILRAPTLGCMLMCLTCAIVGVIVFIRKESLLGETLAHATYPGIMAGALLVALTSLRSFLIWGLLGAATTCILSLLLLNFVKKQLNLKKDSALCFTLTLFFGVGLTFSSYLQTFNSGAYKQARVFLFGQAATITDNYIYIYAAFTLIVVLCVFFFYRQIQIANLDSIFAQAVGVNSKFILILCYSLLIASIAIGIRSIGLFLLSGMLIGPAIAARQWTNRLSRMFILAGVIGLFCGYTGIFISVQVAQNSSYAHSLATGPTILLVSAAISLFSLIFAPKRGWAIRYLRIVKFKKKCNEENILKSLWHLEKKSSKGAKPRAVFAFQSLSRIHFIILLAYLDFKGNLLKINGNLHLSAKGKRRAEHIVRMHRLWELYLVHIGVGIDKVHHNAEDMEHIITPQIEEELLKLMKNPTKDPHNQPIPTRGAIC